LYFSSSLTYFIFSLFGCSLFSHTFISLGPFNLDVFSFVPVFPCRHITLFTAAHLHLGFCGVVDQLSVVDCGGVEFVLAAWLPVLPRLGVSESVQADIRSFDTETSSVDGGESTTESHTDVEGDQGRMLLQRFDCQSWRKLEFLSDHDDCCLVDFV